MDLSIKTETYGSDDRGWEGSAKGSTTAQTITLDVSTFTSGTHYPQGFLTSGIPLGRITASGKYGLYGGRTSEVQTIGLGAASAGTITIGFDGETTAAIAFNATASAVQTALNALSTINPGDVVVTGGPLPGVITLSFGGRYVGQDVPVVVVTPTGLTGGTVTVTTTTPGGSAVSDGREKFAGVLHMPVKVGATSSMPIIAALRWEGVLNLSRMPIPLDAAGQADAANHFLLKP